MGARARGDPLLLQRGGGERSNPLMSRGILVSHSAPSLIYRHTIIFRNGPKLWWLLLAHQCSQHVRHRDNWVKTRFFLLAFILCPFFPSWCSPKGHWRWQSWAKYILEIKCFVWKVQTTYFATAEANGKRIKMFALFNCLAVFYWTFLVVHIPFELQHVCLRI